MKKTKICLGCLRQIDNNDAVCPFCGFDPLELTDKKNLRAGELLYNRYVVGKVLGEGGFGITYTGYDKSEKRAVAIKEYFPSNMVQRNMSRGHEGEVIPCDGNNGNSFARGLERFAKEGNTLKKFNKLTNVVKVYDYFLQNNTGYIIMEYVPGTTLTEHVAKKGNFSTEEILTIIRPIVGDLKCIHEMGMVHRDISPDNIILQANRVAKVIDFGSARTVFQEESLKGQTMTVMLKQQYAPREQYSPKGNIGPWTDVYSLCATIYFMLLGQAPVNVFERSEGDVARKIKEVYPECGNEIADVLEKGMCIDVEGRYQGMDDFQKEFEKAVLKNDQGMRMSEHTIYVDREHKRNVRIPIHKKRRYLAIGLCVIALLIVVGVLGGNGVIKGIKKVKVSNSITESNHTQEDVAGTYQDKNMLSEKDTEKVSKTTAVENETGKMLIMPDITKQESAAAYQTLHAVDSNLIIVVEKKYNNSVKKGCVVSQSIAAGKSYISKKNREIVLVISKGKEDTVASQTPKTTVSSESTRTSQPAKARATTAPKKNNIKIITED